MVLVTQHSYNRLHSCDQQSFRIAYFPHWQIGNPYQRLFYDALAPFGAELSDEFELNLRWLREHAPILDAVHVHWPEPLWTRYQPKWSSLRGYWRFRRFTHSLAQIEALVILRSFLRRAGRLGIHRMWTMHNLECHEGASWRDRLGYRLLARYADLIICHSQSAAESARATYRPRGDVLVIPHGTYDGVYPAPRPVELVRAELGLAVHLPFVVCIGALRDYKGIDIAIDAVNQLQGQVQLLVAGKAHPQFDLPALRETVAQSPHTVLREGFVTDQAFSDLVSASDAVLLPYRKITGSGALLAAWTLRRGVIASDLPYFQEVASMEPDAACFFRAGNSQALAHAIRSYLRVPQDRRSAAVRRVADQYAWSRCVEPLGERIQSWLGAENVARGACL